MRNLRSFVFTSTYWVNNFMPYNTPVKEEVHRPTLQLAGGDCCQEALKGCMLIVWTLMLVHAAASGFNAALTPRGMSTPLSPCSDT